MQQCDVRMWTRTKGFYVKFGWNERQEKFLNEVEKEMLFRVTLYGMGFSIPYLIKKKGGGL